MKKLTVTVLHSLPNRVRLKLSVSIKKLDIFKKSVSHDVEYLELKYNPVTNTVLVTFDPEIILLQEVIYRVITAFSIENGMLPVRLLNEIKVKSLGNWSIYSAATISMSWLHSIINKNDIELQNIMNWFSLGITSAAIMEHAYSETKRKGVFDLEILPAMYLMKSFLNTPNLSLVAMIWLTTFGRHLVVTSNSAKEIKIFRIKNHKDNKYHYIADINDDNSIENISDLMYHIFFRKNKNINKMSQKFITINN